MNFKLIGKLSADVPLAGIYKTYFAIRSLYKQNNLFHSEKLYVFLLNYIRHVKKPKSEIEQLKLKALDKSIVDMLDTIHQQRTDLIFRCLN